MDENPEPEAHLIPPDSPDGPAPPEVDNHLEPHAEILDDPYAGIYPDDFPEDYDLDGMNFGDLDIDGDLGDLGDLDDLGDLEEIYADMMAGYDGELPDFYGDEDEFGAGPYGDIYDQYDGFPGYGDEGEGYEGYEFEGGDIYDGAFDDLDLSIGDLASIDYCEHFLPDSEVMNNERCEEVESAFCDCEERPDFYYTPEQCLMLKYQFSFDYLMQDCCLDGNVENELCSDYMEALALCECHPDEGECTEDEMMEDCDYLWDETMHMCRNVTGNIEWPECGEKIELRL